MKKVLVIESSPRGASSVSNTITDKLISAVKKAHPDATFTVRDLYKSPLPHVSFETVQAYFTPPEARSPELQKAVKLSDELTDELLAADTLIISAPMWNFNIPSALKAWIDHVVRAGRTFSFGADGLKPLATGKKIYVVTASGSVYADGPMKAFDFQEPYLRVVLGFIGMTDVQFFRAEGLNDPSASANAVTAVSNKIENSALA